MRESSAYFKGKKKSFCFGTSREDFRKQCVNPEHTKGGQGYPDAIVPAGGNYSDGTKTIGVNARKWSLQARNIYLDDDEMAKKLAIPGPGTYEDQQRMPATGSYPTSEYQQANIYLTTYKYFILQEL